MYVDKYYEMDPNTEDLLFDGTFLRNDMIVLPGDPNLRMDTTEQVTPDRAELIRTRNRWSMVSNLIVSGSSAVFVATYDDGTKRKIVCDVRWPWLVKLNSIRPDEQPPAQGFDAFGAHHTEVPPSEDLLLPTYQGIARPDDTARFQFRSQGQGVEPQETTQGDPDETDWVKDLRNP